MSMMVNPYAFGVALPPAAGYVTAESLAGQNVTNTGTDLLTLTDTLQVANYFGLWMTTGVNTTQNYTQGRLFINGVQIVEGIANTAQLSAPADTNNYGGLFFHTGSGASETFAVQGGRTSSGTATFTDTRISLCKLGPDDVTLTSAARQTNTTTTLATAATLSWTPGSSGDYIVIVSFLIDTSNTGVRPYYQLTDGTTTIGEHSTLGMVSSVGSSPPRRSVILIMPLSAVSGAKTVNLKFRSGNATIAVGISEIRMLALRCDRFASVRSTVLGANNGGADISYTPTLSQTFTPSAGDHLTIASIIGATNSSSISGQFQYDDDGTVVGGFTHQSRTGSVTDMLNGFAHRLAPYAASSRTQPIERQSETSGVTTTVIAKSAIVTFDLTGI